MKDILEEIIAYKRREVAAAKEVLPPGQLRKKVESRLAEGIPTRSMRQALAMSQTGIIAEFKRKSPSKGWIHADAEPTKVVKAYERGGASAVSILTDEHFFGGSATYVTASRPLVDLPILRKDFIVDEYQLFEARDMGADAVLLIAADLTREECRTLTHRAHELCLEVLLEVHTEGELPYVDEETDMVGVNNRNLGTFHTDVDNSFRLAERLPQSTLKVSESGISSPSTIRQLREAGFRGFLVGETFMREGDPGEALRRFIEEI